MRLLSILNPAADADCGQAAPNLRAPVGFSQIIKIILSQIIVQRNKITRGRRKKGCEWPGEFPAVIQAITPPGKTAIRVKLCEEANPTQNRIVLCPGDRDRIVRQ
jgi:hypothetical protein